MGQGVSVRDASGDTVVCRDTDAAARGAAAAPGEAFGQGGGKRGGAFGQVAGKCTLFCGGGTAQGCRTAADVVR